MVRHMIVVDCETNGLDVGTHQAFEVAWWNLTTNERGRFVPAHNIRKLLHDADVRALQINRYIDRIPGEAFDAKWAQKFDELWGQLMGPECDGATLAGSNPSFDAAMLNKLAETVSGLDNYEHVEPSPWHHRMWDPLRYAVETAGQPEEGAQ